MSATGAVSAVPIPVSGSTGSTGPLVISGTPKMSGSTGSSITLPGTQIVAHQSYILFTDANGVVWRVLADHAP
jgi:hypothetical protein